MTRELDVRGAVQLLIEILTELEENSEPTAGSHRTGELKLKIENLNGTLDELVIEAFSQR